MIYFGMKLKALREMRELSQDDLAAVIGINRSTISQYESSGTYPSVEKLILLARYFGVSSDYLLGLTDSDRFDLSGLTDDQALAVQEIIRQYELLNAQKK